MHGLHLTADLRDCGCDPGFLQDAPALAQGCLEAVAASGLRAVNQLFHRFPDGPAGPGGVTATVLLAESHLCVHTWPELNGATLDVYVCNFGADHAAQARSLLAGLLRLFQARQVERHELRRGELAGMAQS